MTTPRSVDDATYFIRGITFKPRELVDPGDADAVICMRTKNVQKVLDETDLIAVPKRLVRKPELYLQPGDTLISSANSWNLVGKCSYVGTLSYPATAGGFISIVRPKPKTHPRFFFHWLSSPRMQHVVRNLGRQTTNISNLDVSRFKKLDFPEIDYEEQRQIAAILDKADAIRRKREQILALADYFLKSAFVEIFGNPVSNPHGWPLGTIRDLVREVKYGTSQKASKHAGRYKILRMGNITYSGQLDIADLKYVDIEPNSVEKYSVRKGDILFNRTNSKELVGKTTVFDLDETFAYAGYLVRARVNECADPYYISGFLNSDYGKLRLQSMCKSIVGMANINAQDFQNITILIPPTDRQREYRKLHEIVKDQSRKWRIALEEANSLAASLSQRAFRGEL